MALAERLSPEDAQRALGVDPRSLVGITAVRTYLRLVGPQVFKRAGATILAFVFTRFLNRAVYEQFPDRPHGLETIEFGPMPRIIAPELRDPETDDLVAEAVTVPDAASILAMPVDVSEVRTFGALIDAVKRETYRITNETGLMTGVEEA